MAPPVAGGAGARYVGDPEEPDAAARDPGVPAGASRVALDDSLDAIFVFSSISVGLSSGIGFLGVAYVMTVFFCFAMVILWRIDYGFNLIEDRKLQRKLEKQK